MNIPEAIAQKPPVELDEELQNSIISSLFTPPLSSKKQPTVDVNSSLVVNQDDKQLSCFLVQFTSGRTDTFHVDGSGIKVSVGDYVVVEADRGEDLGRVIMDQIYVPLPRRNSTMTSSHDTMPKRIYRVAITAEFETLQNKVRDEQNAITVAQYKVAEWKLPMAISDAEYQWDRRKLTYFFTVTLPQTYPNQPSPRIDFRTLVRDLYQIYRTRIWLFCVDKEQGKNNSTHHRDKFLKQLRIDLKQDAPGSGKSTPEEWSVKEMLSSETFNFGLFTPDNKWSSTGI